MGGSLVSMAMAANCISLNNMQLYAAKYNATQSYAAQMVWHEIPGGICMGSMPPHWHAMPSNAISSNYMPPKAIVDMALVACIPQHGRKPGVNGHGHQCHSTAANAIPRPPMPFHSRQLHIIEQHAIICSQVQRHPELCRPNGMA